MSLKGLVATKLRCPLCKGSLVLSGYSGASYWWCHTCDVEVVDERL